MLLCGSLSPCCVWPLSSLTLGCLRPPGFQVGEGLVGQTPSLWSWSVLFSATQGLRPRGRGTRAPGAVKPAPSPWPRRTSFEGGGPQSPSSGALGPSSSETELPNGQEHRQLGGSSSPCQGRNT